MCYEGFLYASRDRDSVADKGTDTQTSGRGEDSETEQLKYNQLAVDKDTKAMQWRKIALSTKVLGKIGEKSLRPRFILRVLRYDIKAPSIKLKVDKLNLIKSKAFCL